MAHVLTLALINHERLVKHARDLMKEASKTIREQRPRAVWPELVVILTKLEPDGDKIHVKEASVTFNVDTLDTVEALERGRDVIDLCAPDTMASYFYLVGGGSRGKELHVVGLNAVGESYALARPVHSEIVAGIKTRKVVVVGGKVRPVTVGDKLPPFLRLVVEEYKRLAKEKYLWMNPPENYA